MSGKYDLLVVGAGLFGSTIARKALDAGKSVHVVDKRSHVGGNCYSYRRGGIDVHKYGPHVIHTNNKKIIDFLERFCTLNGYSTTVVANYKGEIYSLPFNMATFRELWDITTPSEAMEMLEKQRIPHENPSNLEEHALALVGTEIYEKLIKGYTEKRWGASCKKLSPTVMRRIPFRLTYDSNFFYDRYQGVPSEGYDVMFERMLEGADVSLNTDFLDDKHAFLAEAKSVVFTGQVDEYFNYQYGPLGYRGLKYETKSLDTENFQGCAVVNYTDAETPWMRMVEYKHFTFVKSKETIVSREYATDWQPGDIPYYPLENEENAKLYERYAELIRNECGVRFGGRLGEYKYYDMQDTVASALRMAQEMGF